MTDKLRVLESLKSPGNIIIQWAAEEIARLREERRWIPVGERLPASSAILASDGDVVVEARYYAGDGWETVRGDELWFTPTHWRPLPAPPSEGEVDG